MSKKNKSAQKSNTAKSSSAAAVTAHQANWQMPFLFSVLILVLGYVCYQHADKNNFVSWDDQVYVTENPVLSNPTPANIARLNHMVVSNNFHPVTMWSLLKNVQSNGMKAGPIIRTNVYLHLLNSLLVLFFIGMLTRGRWWVAGFTALLFAVHPMHVESVAWVSERKDVLYVFFGMLSLLTYLRYARSQNLGFLLLTSGLLALACLSKAMAVVFPILYLLVDYWDGRSLWSFRVWLEKTPFFALSILFGLIALDVQAGGNFHGWFDNIEIRNTLKSGDAFGTFNILKFGSYGLAQYCFKLFIPTGLCTYYPYPNLIQAAGMPYLAAPLFLLGYLGVMAWAFWKGRKTLAFGLAWTLVSLALVLQFISVGSVIMADRYAYLPYIGLVFMLVFWADEWLEQRPAAYRWGVWGVLALFSLFCVNLSMRQVAVWKDSISLWSRVIELYPDCASAYNKRGMSWGKERNDLTRAQADFEKAIQLEPTDAYGYEGLGIVSGMQNNHARALEMFSKCIELDPNYHNFYFNRAFAYLQTNQPAQAVPDFEKVLQLNSGNYDKIMPPYIDALFLSGNTTKAAEKINESLSKGLKSASILIARARIKLQNGDRAGAVADLQQSLTLEPGNALAKQILAQLNGG
jgi:protein O-mannosyl-transferase